MTANETDPRSARPAPATNAARRRRRLQRVLLLCVSSLVALGLAEAVLRQVEKSSFGDHATTEETFLTDAVLKHRVKPFTLGHDARGFRNDSVPERADVVALGDSQTWGVNVEREQAWPQELGRLTNRRVYNMSLGGYGPVQYWTLTDEALTLRPRTLVVGLYFGNDLYDAYAMAYQYDAHAPLRRPDAPADIADDTVGRRAEEYWNHERAFTYDYGARGAGGWDDWLRGHTAIGRRLDRAGLWPSPVNLQHKIGRAWAERHPERGAVFEGEGAARTVFTIAYRQAAVDLSEPRIVEGLRITKELLTRINVKAEASGARLLVLLIPTKESAYADVLRERGARLHETHEKLIRQEAAARAEIQAMCERERIVCADALPRLSEAVRSGARVYSQSAESHPHASGYALISAVVCDELARRGW
ncbi:MAG TPA: hypothetical protein VF240_08140 [Pyrinomonadaceae bacterium]